MRAAVPSGPIVEVTDLVVQFGRVRVVDGVSLSVEAGQATALVGRNGAGKSTTLRALAGVLPPTSGAVRVAGVDASSDPIGARARIGYCPDVGGLIPRATPWEHLALAARLRGLADGWQIRAETLLAAFELTSAADRVTSGFSHGMGRRLSVLLAAFAEPDVLLLDEPFDGVDPLGVDATLELVAATRSRGGTVIVSTHLIELAVRACDTAVVLRGGRTVATIAAVELEGAPGADRYRSLLTAPGAVPAT